MPALPTVTAGKTTRSCGIARRHGIRRLNERDRRKGASPLPHRDAM